jgi:hypothetical protein
LKSVQEVSKHVAHVMQGLVHKWLMLRRAPGRARTCNPMIRSYTKIGFPYFRSIRINQLTKQLLDFICEDYHATHSGLWLIELDQKNVEKVWRSASL